MRRVVVVSLCVALGLVWCTAASAQVQMKKSDSGVEVTLSGQPFTTYVFKSVVKPILWPIIGPTGKEMTRAWPMREDDPVEKKDHPHQRSFWFDHGNVNGVNFWMETGDDSQGTIQHKELVKAEGGPIGTIVTKNDWNGPDGKTIVTDVRTLRFGGDTNARWIDFGVVVTAAAGEVKFVDTKEGSFGLRIAESMRTDRGGKLFTSEGLNEGDGTKDPLPPWGKPAAWIDYYGPVQGETLGIAILNHPSSLRYPTRWHVRKYGLFAANPWGQGDFTAGKEHSDYMMKKGDTFTLRYRVIFHKGDAKEGKIAEAFAAFAKD